MEEKKDFYQITEEICLKDPRYKADSYEFVIHALHFTQDRLKRKTHVTGRELSEGMREYAIEQYGPMAKTVLAHWGVNKTQDFGDIVFNLIDKKMLSKAETDSPEDFKDVYDFKRAFGNVLGDSITRQQP